MTPLLVCILGCLLYVAVKTAGGRNKILAFATIFCAKKSNLAYGRALRFCKILASLYRKHSRYASSLGQVLSGKAKRNGKMVLPKEGEKAERVGKRLT